MAEAARDHSDSKRTVDDLFQLLIHVYNMRPAIARVEILDHLQRDQLQVDLHIQGGAQKTYPMRQATAQELEEGAPIEAAIGVILDMYHIYETAPPEGVSEPVHFQKWGGLLDLVICEECLIVEPNCAHDYPWDAYSFTVRNWSHVKELWRNPNRASPDLSAPDSIPASGTPSRSAKTLFTAAVTSTARDSTDWISRAVEQYSKELTGLSVRAACKLLAAWMSAGKVKTDKSPQLLPAQKPIGWSRIKTIVVDQELLPIKSAGK